MVAATAVALAMAAPARAGSEDTALELGTARFTAGDFAGAIAPLREAHTAAPADPDATLLLGIAYYRTGALGDARSLLEAAERSDDAATQASARVFLGLIAASGGDVDRARTYYAAVARSSTELGVAGRHLLEQSGPERWSIVAIVRPEYDSNVGLLPATAAPPGPGRGAGNGDGDGDVALIAAATVRPIEDLALVLDDALLYRREAQLTAYDMLSDAVGATYLIADRRNRASAAYHFEVSTLGGARYERGHVVDAGYRRALGGELGAAVRYTFAARDYAQAAYAGYSGLDHTGVVELAWGSPTGPSEIALGYVIARETTDDPALAAVAQGGRVAVRSRPWQGADLRASAIATDRVYDAASAGRVDVQVRGEAALYLELSGSLGIVLGGTVLRNASNVADYDYAKWTVFAGLVAGASS